MNLDRLAATVEFAVIVATLVLGVAAFVVFTQLFKLRKPNYLGDKNVSSRSGEH